TREGTGSGAGRGRGGGWSGVDPGRAGEPDANLERTDDPGTSTGSRTVGRTAGAISDRLGPRLAGGVGFCGAGAATGRSGPLDRLGCRATTGAPAWSRWLEPFSDSAKRQVPQSGVAAFEYELGADGRRFPTALPLPPVVG